jgi:hypothetical protein
MFKTSFCAVFFVFGFLQLFPMELVGKPLKNDSAAEIIRRAIAAHGGKRNLQKLAAFHLQAKGTIYATLAGRSDESPLTVDFFFQEPSNVRYVFKLRFDGQPLTMVRVFNGNKAWRKLNDKTEEQPEIALDGWRQSTYASKLKRLYPLLDEPDYVLTLMDQVDVSRRPANVVKVTHKGWKDLDLCFDKTTNLLVKTQGMINDDDGKAHLEEELLSNHKDFSGLKQFTTYVRIIDGKRNIELETIDVRFRARFEDQVFEKP